MLTDQRVFLRQFWKKYRTTGAILPSGRALSRALSRFVREGSGGRKILEVGPGTGAVTVEIVKRMKPEDRLDVVELNDEFVARLQQRFATEPLFQTVAGRSQILHKNVEHLEADRSYDLIISGLPLNNFTVDEVQRILAAFARLSKSGGVLSFFEYVAIRKAKALVSGPDVRARLRGIAAALDKLFEYEIERDCVLRNVTPAWVHHVRLP
jgi:phosphatidylethanolamine/phosphatidyl-N-methylethanolamine N-methyltransferase